MYYIGIDWADEKHDLCILAENGVVHSAFEISNDQRGFQRPRPPSSEAKTTDVLGASRAGKPANSPVGAISRRRGTLQRARAVFYYRAPDARR